MSRPPAPHEAQRRVRIIAGIGEQPGHEAVGLTLGHADVPPFASARIEPVGVPQKVVRQFVRDRGCEFIFAIAEPGEVAPDQHPPSIGDSALACDDFEPAATGSHAGDVPPAAVLERQFDFAIGGKRCFDDIVQPDQPAPVVRGFGGDVGNVYSIDGRDLIAGTQARGVGRRAGGRRLHCHRAGQAESRADSIGPRICSRVEQQQADRRARLVAEGGIATAETPTDGKQSLVQPAERVQIGDERVGSDG